RKSFIAGDYESFLKAHVDELAREQKICAVREQLQSEETRRKMLKLLQDVYSDVETQVLFEAMKGIKIEISYQQSYEKKQNIPLNAVTSKTIQQSVIVCKNKATGKYYIHIEDLKDGAQLLLMTPEGTTVARDTNLFDQLKDEKIDYLLSYKLITEMQLEKYNEYESQQPEYDVAPNVNYPRNTTRVRSIVRDNPVACTKKVKPRGCTVNGMHYLSANDAVAALCQAGVIKQRDIPTSSFNAHLWLSTKQDSFGYTYIRDSF
ncbi:MAG: hypothetical protein PHH28_15255, partial [Desulfuromonadaceae bacterium]|nr:hypothetical protein [Desulfuromonadaceae bacterium]